MAESTLSLTFANYQSSVGRALGYSSDTATWSSAQTTHVARVIADGYQDFLGAHDWNFLKVATTATLSSGTATFSMPDNFSGIMLEPFTYAAGVGSLMSGIRMVSPEDIRVLKQFGTASGQPYCYSMQVLSAATPVDPTTASTRWQATFYPTPSAAYVLTYRYQIISGALSSTNYPYGGAMHSRTLQAFINAAAVLEAKGEIGEWEAKKNQLLERSIEIDRQTMPVIRGMVTDGISGVPANYVIGTQATRNSVQY